MKIRPSRNKLKLVIVSWPGLFPLEDVAQPCSRSGPRVQFVSSREDTRRRVPFRSDREVAVSVRLWSRLLVWSLSWSPAIFLDQTGSRLRRPRPSSGTVLRRGKQVWRLLWRGDTIDDRFFFARSWAEIKGFVKFVELNSIYRNKKIKNRFVYSIDRWLTMDVSLILKLNKDWIIIYLDKNGLLFFCI